MTKIESMLWTCLALSALIVSSAVAQETTTPASVATPKPEDALTSPAAANNVSSETVIIRVNGEPITQGDLVEMVDRMMKSQLQQIQAMGQELKPEDLESLRPNMETRARETLVDTAVLEQAIAKRKSEVTDEAVAERLQEVRKMVEASENRTLEERLKDSNLELSVIEEQIRQELAARGLIEEYAEEFEPTEEEVQQFFEQHKEQLSDQPETVRASHILLGYEGDARDPNFKPSEQDMKQAREKAQQALERVKGGEDFGKVATELSTDPGSAAKGGDLGYFQKGQMVPSFDAAVWKLKEGEISGLVESPFGFHIIKRTGYKEGKPASFEELKSRIESELRARKMGEQLPVAIEKLKEQAQVEMVVPAPTLSAPAGAPQSPVFPLQLQQDSNTEKQ